MDPRGQKTGHPGWEDYLAGLVEEHGSLAALAERLATLRGHSEDVASIERALRRLRGRGTQSGGKWGARLLRAYGLPPDVDARLRFMGSYHSRFVDLPVPLCLDLVQLWDRPPTSEGRLGRMWLALARVVIAFRQQDHATAAAQLDLARRSEPDENGRIEIALGQALLASREARGVVPAVLDPVEGWLAELSGPEADCLRARWAGQVAFALHRAGDHAAAEARMLALPDADDTPPFARARRANGLAYSRHRLGDPAAALAYARASARHAGDAGHVRLRAMALLMIARVASGTPEGADARARARGIAEALEDPTLLLRAG